LDLVTALDRQLNTARLRLGWWRLRKRGAWQEPGKRKESDD